MHDLDRLVGQIYDAAVEPGRWPQVLELLSDFLEGAATKLTFQNARTLRSEASSVRMPPEADRTYAQYYYKTNVFLPRIAKLRAGALVPVWNLLPREAYQRSEFYNDFCRPGDMCHPIGVVLANEPDVRVVFTCGRAKAAGEFEPEPWNNISRMRRSRPPEARNVYFLNTRALPLTSRTGGQRAFAAAAGVALTAAVAALLNRWLAQKAERHNPPIGRFITVQGVRLHYVDRGTGRPLVLLHGNGSMIEDFQSSGLINLAAKKYRVIAFDRPGFGHSERPRHTTWTPQAQADLIAAALKKIGVSKPIVLGHSWGTLVAISLALKSPAEV